MKKYLRWLSIPIEVRFYEVDSYNIVNNMYYLSWFEMGRFAIAEKAGLLVDRFREELLAFVVLEAKVRYFKPVTFVTKIECQSCISKVEKSRIKFLHKIVNSVTKEIMAEGETTVVLTRNGTLLLDMPEWVKFKINRYISEFQGGVKND